MAEYHVGCGLAGIYAGTLNKKGDRWLNKSPVTEEAIAAVRDWLMLEKPNGQKSHGYEWTRKDGKKVSLMVKEYDD